MLNTRGGGDSPFNLLRTHQLAANLQAGVFPARWMPDAAYGLGYPFFSYYAALPYYLAAGFTLAGLDILSAVKLTQTLFFAAAAVGMYGWARRALQGRAAAWLAAAAYTLAPYHLVNLYVRGDSLSEFAAFACYPLVLWGLDRLAARPSPGQVIPPALAYAALVLTHNLSAFLFSPFALLYLALLAWRHRQRPWPILALGGLSLSLAFALSAWYWLPALAEIDAVQLTAQTSGYFFYANHFRALDLVQPTLAFNYGAITPEQPTAFAAMGSAQAVLALGGTAAAIFVLARSRSADHRAPIAAHHVVFVIAGLLLATWLVTPLSRPVWDLLPPLQMIQFPWRLLSVQAIFTALLAGVAVAVLPGERTWSAGRWIAAAILAILLGVNGLAGLRPDYLPIAAEEVTVERLQLHELFTGNIGSTIRYEYLPRQAVPRPYTGPALFDPDRSPRAVALEGVLLRAEETDRAPTRRTWTVETGGEGAAIAFPLYYWPGWQAAVDGAPAEVRPAPDSGTLALAVPPGSHTVALWLGPTPARMAGELVSLLTALLLATAGVIRWRLLRRPETEPVIFRRAQDDGFAQPASFSGSTEPSIRAVNGRLGSWILGGAFTLTLALLVALAPCVSPGAPGAPGGSDLTMDFDRQPYLHHNPDGVDLGGWHLTGYRYSADRLAPGDTLRVTLEGAHTARRSTRNDEKGFAEITPLASEWTRAFGTLAMTGWQDSCLGRGSFVSTTSHTEGVPGGTVPVPPGGGCGEQEPPTSTLETCEVIFEAQAQESSPSVTLHLVSPAAVRQEELPPLATAEAAAPAAAATIPLDLRIPRDAGPGMYLLRLEGGASHVYLQPVWVAAGEPAADRPTLATFAEGALRLHRIEAAQPTPTRLDLRFDWSAAAPVAANYKLSLRLADPAGNEWTRLDAQPGYGFLPTGLWPAGQVVRDRLSLPLPPGTPPGSSYTLTAILYREVTGEAVGEYACPISLDLATLRPEVSAATYIGGGLALGRLEAPESVRQGETLPLTAYWLALERPSADYAAAWRLEGAEQTINATLDLAPGSPPTGWPAGAWIAGRAGLPIPSTATPGDYTLSLTLLDAAGAPVGRYTHPQPVRVEGRQRIWELPAMQREVGTRFDGTIELAGYDLAREGDALKLTLHWRALAAPGRHYAFFVHLADPATGVPAAQVDGMPRGSTYPTGVWAPGEVVSDEVVLSLAGVNAGRYDLAVGWYDPDDPDDRLPAVDSAGNPLPDGRVILPDGVEVP